MEDRELQRLKRGDLLELLLEQSKEIDNLKKALEEKELQIQELMKKLENREIDLDNAGTIAEASFKLNGVFDAVENAAKQYLENLEALHAKNKYLTEKKEEEVENRCSAMLQTTMERCEVMKEDTTKQCEEMLASTETKCMNREKEAEERCTALDQKAKSDVDKRWSEFSKRLEKFYTDHIGLRELLSKSGEM